MNWAALGFGTFLGVTNIGLMGSLISKGNLPVVDFPVGSYTSYEMEATKDGYKIRYNANDPKVMIKTENVVKPSSGLFSKGRIFFRGNPLLPPRAGITAKCMLVNHANDEQTYARIRSCRKNLNR